MKHYLVAPRLLLTNLLPNSSTAESLGGKWGREATKGGCVGVARRGEGETEASRESSQVVATTRDKTRIGQRLSTPALRITLR